MSAAQVKLRPETSCLAPFCTPGGGELTSVSLSSPKQWISFNMCLDAHVWYTPDVIMLIFASSWEFFKLGFIIRLFLEFLPPHYNLFLKEKHTKPSPTDMVWTPDI